MKKINTITVKHITDENPDLTYLGEYSSKPEKIHIDRQARGDMQRGEYRYFNLGCGDAEYIEQDYKRYEAYNNQQWYAIGIKAKAEILTSVDGKTWLCNDIESGGLWGNRIRF